jgi:hypothetical protein
MDALPRGCRLHRRRRTDGPLHLLDRRRHTVKEVVYEEPEELLFTEITEEPAEPAGTR